MREALAQAHSLIVICSSAGAQSRWVNEEVREFTRLGRRDRIQCLIVPEADAPEGEDRLSHVRAQAPGRSATVLTRGGWASS